jgi:replicative DNA helicase
MLSLAGTRTPPANLEAEQALLGALLANNKAFDYVAGFLRPDHFADAAHAQIYAAIQRRLDGGRLADAVTLRGEFAQNGLLDDAGGVAYLGQLLVAMTGIINAGEYGRVIEDCWLRRQMIAAGEALVNLSYGQEPELDARGIMARADQVLLDLAQDGQGQGGRAEAGGNVARVMMDDVMAAIGRGGALPGLTWGLKGLDRMTGGLFPGQLVTIGGKSSMGKTSMALKIASGAARAGGKVLLVSAEMLSSSIMARLVCAEAGLPLTAYTRGGYEDEGGHWCRLGKAQLDQMADAARRCGALPIHWDHHSRTIGAIRTQARRLQRAKGGGLDLIVVDYLTRLKAEGKSDNRHVEITGLVKGLKDTAMALGVPIVLLSQLSRKVDGRDDKMPTLGDLRESGSIEEESDAVIFLHREHYYLMRGKPARGPKERAADYDQRVLEWQDALHRSCGRAVAYIAKQRQGRIGPVDVRWDDATAMFMDDDMAGHG